MIVADWINNVDLKPYIKQITLNSNIKEDCLDLKNQYNNKKVVAVHIRWGDYILFHKRENIEKLTVDIIGKIKEKTNTKYIYLASDNWEPFDIFEKNNYIVINKNISNIELIKKYQQNEKGLHKIIMQQQDKEVFDRLQIFDMYSLSLYDYLIRPKFSTFSAISECWSELNYKYIEHY